MTAAPPSAEAAPERWLADEMLGRLARYLRFLGWDTEYVRGLDDAAVIRRAVAEGRFLLTRDRALAQRLPSALLVGSVDVVDQLAEVLARFPGAPSELSFDRCPEDNRRLAPAPPPGPDGSWPKGVPVDLADRGMPVWVCPACARHYWEGSHATKIRATVAEAQDRARRT